MDYFENFREYMLKSFDLDICKNMYSIVNGRPMLYIHNINKITTKKESALNYNQPNKIYNRIQKYNSRGFDFNCINYNIGEKSISPFLVYKQNEFGRLEKLTFLGQVYEPIDVITQLNCWEGKMVGYIYKKDNLDNLFEDLKYVQDCRKVPVYDFKKIFNFLSNKNKEDIHISCPCSCKLSVNHKHTKCKVHVKYGKKIKIDIVMIIFNDLTDDLKIKYDKLFETKVCESGFLNMNDVTVDGNNVVIFNADKHTLNMPKPIPMEVDEDDEMEIN